MLRPRAATDTTAAMKIRSKIAAARRDGSGSDPSKQQQSQSDFHERQPPSDDGCEGGWKQLVGAYR